MVRMRTAALRHDLEQRASRLDAGDPRHVEVHDHDVGLELRHPAKRRLAARGLSGVEAALRDERAEARAEQIVVVHDQDPRLVPCIFPRHPYLGVAA
jgi:hypothetical protein